MKNKKVLLTGILLVIISFVCIFSVFAHKGRTDGSGGHRDNNNVSGLGSYHYHCGGYPAHLHTNGVCPYKSYSSSSYSSTSDSYDEGYDDGYDKGYDEGYDEGYDAGYDEGLNDSYDVGYDKGYDKGYSDGIEECETYAIILLASIFAILIIVLLVRFIKKRIKE